MSKVESTKMKTSKKSSKQKKKNAKVARNKKLFLFSYPKAIVQLQEKIILEVFETVFEQFPVKIDKLKRILVNTNPMDEHVLSDVSKLFREPPSLKDIKVAQDGQKLSPETGHCDHNTQEVVHLAYDGHIAVNSRLLKLAEMVDSFADFYVDWQKNFELAMALLRPRLNEEVHLVIENRDALTECVADMLSSVEAIKESTVGIFEQRAAHAKNIQLSPHIVDNRKMFTLHERNAWYELCLSLQRLHTVFTITFDIFAKNVPKLFV